MSNENQKGGLGLPVAGGVLGGAGAYFATQKVDKVKQWVSTPKYNSYEELVKEMSDNDKFTKELENASEEGKTVLNQAKADADAKIAAEAKYQTDLDAYVKEHSVAKQAEDTQAIKDLQKQVADLEAGVKAKEAAASQVVPHKEVTRRLTKEEAHNAKIQQLESKVNARKKVLEMKDNIAKKEAEIAGVNRELRTRVTLPGSESYGKNLLAAEAGELVGDNKRAAEAIKEKIKVLTQQEQELNELIDIEAKKLSKISRKSGNLDQAIIDVEKNIEQRIKGIKGLTKSQKEQVISEAKKGLKDRINFMDQLAVKEIELAGLKQEYERIPAATRELFETKDYKSLLARNEGELLELQMQKDIAAERKKHVKKQWEARKAARQSAATRTEEHIRVQANGIDETIKITKETAPKFEYVPFEDTLTDQGKAKYKEYKKAVAKRGTKTVQVADSAAVKAVDPSIAADKAKIQELTEQIAKERAALPKQAVKNAEELTEEFIKANGTKEDAVKKAVKGLSDDAAEGLKKITKTSNWKQWGGVAVCALAGMGLFSALRPKHKEQA